MAVLVALGIALLCLPIFVWLNAQIFWHEVPSRRPTGSMTKEERDAHMWKTYGV